MSILAGIAGLSSIIGGVTGLVGSVVNKHYALKEAAQKLEERKVDNAHEALMADKEYARLVKISEIDLTKTELIGQNDAWSKSYEVFTTPLTSGAKLTGWRLSLATCSDVFNSAVRPLSTVYYQLLMGLLGTYAAWYMYNFQDQFFSSSEYTTQLILIIFSIFDMILFQASMSLGWWFGNRGVSRKSGK